MAATGLSREALAVSRNRIAVCSRLALVIAFSTLALLAGVVDAQFLRNVFISELAWMGTTTSYNDENTLIILDRDLAWTTCRMCAGTTPRTSRRPLDWSCSHHPDFATAVASVAGALYDNLR